MVVYRGVISPPGLVLFGIDLELSVSFGWFVSLAARIVMAVPGPVTYLAGPPLQFEAGESAPSREE